MTGFSRSLHLQENKQRARRSRRPLTGAHDHAHARVRHEAEIGRYRYNKEQDRGWSVPVEVRVFLMDADSLRPDFPEARQRKRRWFSPQDAARRVVEPGLKEILLALPPVPG